jgi:predicted DNA-binding transcriptional regulator YafY
MSISKSGKQSSSTNARPSNHETLLMTLAMLDMIPKVGKITASEMHTRLLEMGYERDLRSIQRQLEVLSSQFSIERDDCSKPYGYKWSRDAKGISIPGLTLHESLLLNMAEKYLRNLLPSSLKQAMDGFFNQARFNLGNVPDEKLERRWLNKVRVVSPGVALLPPEIKGGILEAISQALFHETWLEVEYINQGSERKRHRVMPLGLAQQGARLVLVARFEGYENERNLAVSRITKATDTQLPFPPVKGFDLEAYEKRGGFGYGHGKTIQLKFRIDKKLGMFLTESRLSKDQTVNELDTQLEIAATVVESEHLVWWLRGFGRQVEVLAPKALVIQIAS